MNGVETLVERRRNLRAAEPGGKVEHTGKVAGRLLSDGDFTYSYGRAKGDVTLTDRAGRTASNLFAAWRPDICRAWVSHACGVFHAPSVKMRRTPGLVTCGDADTARDILSRDFVARARAAGQSVVWKSFPNRPHDVPEGSLALARAFFTHHDAVNRGDLGDRGGRFVKAALPASELSAPDAPFVGDDPDGTYWPAGSAEAQSIPEEDCVPLPSRAVAEAWGKEGMARMAAVADGGSSAAGQGQAVQSGKWSFAVDGVDFVCRVPAASMPESRVAGNK